MTVTPLSVSHPVIFSIWENDNCSLQLNEYVASTLQMCTVDVAEHNCIINKINSDWIGYGDDLKAEVERLKKELEENKLIASKLNLPFNNGVVEGERRAINKVKEEIADSLTAYQVQQKLGLGEEE